MPKFNVTITRDTTESTTVDVEAPDAAVARHLALEEALTAPSNFDWVQDDCSGGEAYLADPDGCVSEIT